MNSASTLNIHEFRIIDFNVYNQAMCDDSREDNAEFKVQVFGINETGKTYSALVDGYKPFFYVLVDRLWTETTKNRFLDFIKKKIGNYYKSSIDENECEFVHRKKLYGFDGGQQHKFIKLVFNNTNAFNKVKNLWYSDYNKDTKERHLLKEGLVFEKVQTRIYESNFPAVLRFIHIRELSSSGWVSLKNPIPVDAESRTTTGDYEFTLDYENIVPLNDKETRVPYKIMSFDTEENSSHGDFPVPIKTYKKLTTNIVEYFQSQIQLALTKDLCKNILKKIILTAFSKTEGEGDCLENHVDLVYPKITSDGKWTKRDKTMVESSKEQLLQMFEDWMNIKISALAATDDMLTIEKMFEKQQIMEDEKGEKEDKGKAGDEDDEEEEDDDGEEEDDEEDGEDLNDSGRNDSGRKQPSKKHTTTSKTIVDILCDKTYDRNKAMTDINMSLNKCFPLLEGDKVTFIGSTFMRFGEKEPYKNHCIVLNTCAKLPMENCELEVYDSEREVLLAWQRLVQRENPDIVIGYNIFGFDYEYMFRRAEENNCDREFLKLSRNTDELCGNVDRETGQIKLEENSIQIASGTHEFKYIKMNGRLQIDLYNFFRREENLPSYKLDYVSGYYIGDFVKHFDHDHIALDPLEKPLNPLEKPLDHLEKDLDQITKIFSGNLTGLSDDSFVHFEEIGYSTDYYADGAKFKVFQVNKLDGTFCIRGHITPEKNKKIRWCLAKDDVTPKDIFRLTNGTADDRAIVAKYCLQDCNLVHYLFNKVDVLTGLIEMANICSVPMNFLVLRGQGIKLTSYIAKKCREKKTLMPTIEKGSFDDGYEGAFVLEPKKNIYLDDKPVPCNDFASLYPSSIISENLSHDTKVLTKEYDLSGNLVSETGEKNADGTFKYDNLPGYTYVDISTDTFRYIRKNAAAAPKKVVTGKKVCRFIQPNEETGEYVGILPAILKELLKARKDTRKKIPQQTDEFMKNILDKRQLGYKNTANSLYGQCGAKTSTFYEKDIAACTTSTGRKMLIFAKTVIEQCYKNRVCETSKFGKVRTNAEYIYGDTDSVFYTFNLQTLDGEPIVGITALEITMELAQEAGKLVSMWLKPPHDFEYEKTLSPMVLIEKKKYFGMVYEFDVNKCKRKDMGNPVKRRDSVPIVKDIFGGSTEILMLKKNILMAIDYIKNILQNIVDGKYPIEKFILTKSLRSGYKNPKSIAHKVLADRIAARDPGNKPCSGDRIPFVYVVTANKKALQGDRIETPTFVKENNLKIDYSFYITNQIMKPILQIFALGLESIWKSQNKYSKLQKYKKEENAIHSKFKDDPKKAIKAIEKMRCKEVKQIIFDDYLRESNNASQGNQSVKKFFGK